MGITQIASSFFFFRISGRALEKRASPPEFVTRADNVWIKRQHHDALLVWIKRQLTMH
jgi:hypothetical protein